MGRALGKTGAKAMARAPMKTGAKAMVRAAGKSGETSRGRVAGTSSILLKGSVAGGAASRSGPQSFETGDDAADQIVAIERAKIDPGSIHYGLEPGHQFGEAGLCIPAEPFPRFDPNRDKTPPNTPAACRPIISPDSPGPATRPSVSPGRRRPTIARSADTTVAIFGYPPVVW